MNIPPPITALAAPAVLPPSQPESQSLFLSLFLSLSQHPR